MKYSIKLFIVLGLVFIISACGQVGGDEKDGNGNLTAAGSGACYLDEDRDGYGDPNNMVESEDPPANCIEDNTDCNDSDDTVYPGAVEKCGDGIDQNCNGSDLDCSQVDADEDGYTAEDDCNDFDYTIYPGATEICGDGIDQDCNGSDPACPPVDADNDGSPADVDCNDNDANIHPGAAEICDDTIDQNCDGSDLLCSQVDADNDGSPEGTDCNDSDPNIYPGAAEICGDTIDQDCDGSDLVCTTVDADNDGSPEGTDCNDSDPNIYPGATEICDNTIDDNCDGLTDDADTTTCGAASGPPLPPVSVSATDCDPVNYDPNHANIAITWQPNPEGPAPAYYVVYRTTYDKDNPYASVSPDVTGTSFEFVQTWEEVLDVIGPAPGLSGDATDADKLAFINALNQYRDKALPVLMDFKAPAFFKVQACNTEGCSEMSSADAGQAEQIHTADYSEVALHMIPYWGYAQLIALADMPSGAGGLSWCGIDLCGSGGGLAMGRVAYAEELMNIDVVYNNYTETDPNYPGSYFVANGTLGGAQGRLKTQRGEFDLVGDFNLSTNAADVQLHMYAHIGGLASGSRYHDGYADITYKGNTYQFTLPIQAADDISGNPATAPEPSIPVRTDTGAWQASKGPSPEPFSQEPPSAQCPRIMTAYEIPTCTATTAPGYCTDGDTQTVTCGQGECASTGIETCVDGQWTGSTCVPGSPTDEIDDDRDNDCDGEVDEGVTAGECTDGETRPIACGQGECASTGVETCVDGQWAGSTCVPGLPTDEIDDDRDNDCDGEVDEGVSAGECTNGETREVTCGQGECEATVIESCVSGEWADVTCVPGDAAAEICGNNQDDDCDGLNDQSDPDCQTSTATGPPLPPINVSATDADPNTYDPDHQNITVTWEPDTSGPAAEYYVVYRATYGENNAYEVVSPDVADTSFEFIQTWDEVVDIIGPNPGLAGDTTDEAKLAFINALNDYREMALPTLMDFKAPAFFKVQACNAEGCSEMSAADAGQAEYIHTEEYSEVALHMIPSWGYAQLIALADAKSGVAGVSWCGIDLCGSGGGRAMGRVLLSLMTFKVDIDVVYENYTETDPTHPEAYFVADGYLGGGHDLAPAQQGNFNLVGDFNLSTNAADVQLHMYAHIGAWEGTTRYHDGYADITYKGSTYQFSLPIQAADDISGHAATPPTAIIPARTDTGDWVSSQGRTIVPLAEEPPAAACSRNWEAYVIPESCPASVAP